MTYPMPDNDPWFIDPSGMKVQGGGTTSSGKAIDMSIVWIRVRAFRMHIKLLPVG